MVACSLLLALLLLFGERVSAGKGFAARTVTDRGDFPRSRALKEQRLSRLRLQPGLRFETAELAKQLCETRADYRQGKSVARPGTALKGGVAFCEKETAGPRVRKDHWNWVDAVSQFVKDTMRIALIPGHLRPGKSFGLQKHHPIPPLPGAGLLRWAMQFRLGKAELPTKTSAFDGLMVVSGERYSWWTIVLQFLSNYLTGGDSPSIKPSHDDMRNMCKMAFEFLVLQALDLECRCAHLGGACHDAVTGYWLLDAIRKRLRRLLVPRMPRCETSGPLGAEL